MHLIANRRELVECRLTFLKTDFHLDENYALLDYYAASSGNSLPTFQENLSVQSSRVGLTLKKLDQ